jgi:hypothetical protein
VHIAEVGVQSRALSDEVRRAGNELRMRHLQTSDARVTAFCSVKKHTKNENGELLFAVFVVAADSTLVRHHRDRSRAISLAYFKRVAVMMMLSVVVFAAVACAFGAEALTGFASALTLNRATVMVINMAANKVELPTLSLLIVFVFMMFSFGFGWWFVLRLLM